MFLRRMNVPCWSDPVRFLLGRDEHERPAVPDQSVRLELCGDRARGIALLDQEFDLGRILRHGRGQGRAELLGDDVLDERQLERGRIVLGDAHDRVGDGRAKCGESDTQHDRGQDDREDQELQQADDAATGSSTAAATPAWHGLGVLGDRLGRVCVRIVWGGPRRAAVPGASAGADRHRLVSWGSGGRGMDERSPCRVSSSSWRMIAAASRSTLAR